MQRSYRVTTRRQSFGLPNGTPITARQCIAQQCHARDGRGVCGAACRICRRSATVSRPGMWGRIFVPQRFPEPVGVRAAVSEQPVDMWQAARQCPRADVVVTCPAVKDGVRPDARAGLDAPDQTAFVTVLGPRADQCLLPLFDAQTCRCAPSETSRRSSRSLPRRPAFPTDVKRLVRAKGGRHIAPA